ncbi:peptidase [Flavobacterium phage Fpv20]|uniref:peptidase n=1 Tax=Flavobacterium phage Fpv20 TaxID=1814283 RepID=UPI000815014B|nr:peptidase [Flavobacterium phage Fpv20]ANB40850.1 peptidase [Flavobacterium phage Fpv20]
MGNKSIVEQIKDLTNKVKCLCKLQSNSLTIDNLIPYELKSEKGQPDGYAPLNNSSQIDSQYLPSYVDDVLEFADLASFPVSGESGKIYIALDSNLQYRWGGSIYVPFSGGTISYSYLYFSKTNINIHSLPLDSNWYYWRGDHVRPEFTNFENIPLGNGVSPNNFSNNVRSDFPIPKGYFVDISKTNINIHSLPLDSNWYYWRGDYVRPEFTNFENIPLGNGVSPNNFSNNVRSDFPIPKGYFVDKILIYGPYTDRCNIDFCFMKQDILKNSLDSRVVNPRIISLFNYDLNVNNVNMDDGIVPFRTTAYFAPISDSNDTDINGILSTLSLYTRKTNSVGGVSISLQIILKKKID